MTKRKTSIIASLTIGVLMVCLSACGGPSYEKEELESKGAFRLEQIMFETGVDQMQGALRNSGYSGHILNIHPENPQYMQDVYGMTQDELCRYAYDCVKKDYSDLGWLEKSLCEALDRAHDLDDEVGITKVSTFISGMFDYEMRTYADGDELLIDMGVYALPYMEKYGFVGVPRYLVNLCKKEYLLTDCVAAVVRNLVYMPEVNEPTLLDIMVMEGKVMYVTNRVLPNVADSVKLRYSGDQLDWARKNEKNMWAYLMQEQLLFESNHARYHNLVDEAPFTNAFGNTSAPRCATFLGWHIVEDYMDKTGASVKELMAETDSQKILRQSGYRAI